MIFAKIDVSLPRHYRIMDVRPECVRIPLGIRSESDRNDNDACKAIARVAALGVWTAALCFTRDHMLDGFCPLSALDGLAVDAIVEELVRQGLFERAEREGRAGVIIVNYAKHNETKADIDRRLDRDRARKSPERATRGRSHSTPPPYGLQPDSARIPPGIQPPSAGIPRSESETETETESKELPSQAPARPEARSGKGRAGDHQALIAHYAAEFERLKGAKPVIGAKGGAGAKKLLEGRTLAEAKAIVDRALSDPWVLDKAPDLASIAGRINAFIGKASSPSGGSRVPLQPAGGSWKKADGFE